MPSVHGNQKRPDNPRRKPLAPLPEQLTGPVRDFVTALRHMHGELGLSLSDLESRLPASRSSLSRYLRGQSLPDERLLVQWCKLSFTGEDRLPELVRLLHLAVDAAGAQELAGEARQGPDGPDGADRAEAADGDPAGGPEGSGPRRGKRLAVLAGLGVLVVLAGSAALAMSLGQDSSAGGEDGRKSSATEVVTVHNIDQNCTREHARERARECRLGLALDPYAPYRPSNIGGHVWHGDRLTADCRIANGVTVTDEVGGHSSVWYRVRQKEHTLWLPGIRLAHDRLQYSSLRNCPD
ncbi:helix-turn-helix transcriptional regulator [Streptomyces physcomitrii]|uniref:helix-turn-helix transcriptional regulator n=1 Tax=Streptomyces physcomitrii TaxID=2724184 RepID=UPI00343A4199